MDIQAKHTIFCDSCKRAIRLPQKGVKQTPEEKAAEPIPLEAQLEDGLGNPKTYHYCDEECMRVFLNARRRKNVKASIEIDILNNEVRKVIEEV